MLAQLTSGDKKYLKLFDSIDKLSEYDEEKILKTFRKDPSFVKQIAYNKNYLYNSILNSLSYFYKGQDGELSTLSLQVKILMDKNLYVHAKKLLKKVKEKIKAQEKFEDLLKILHLELDIVRNTENAKMFATEIHAIEFQQKVVMEKLVNLQEYQKLDNETFILIKTLHVARKDNELEVAQELSVHPLMEGEIQALSTRAKIAYNEIHRRLAFYAGDRPTSDEHSHRIIELYENNPEILEGEKINYFKQLIHFGINQFKLQNFESAVPVVRKLNALTASTPKERLIKFNGLLFELLMRIDSGVQDGVEDLLLNIEVEMDYLQNDLSVITLLSTQYHLAIYYTLTGEFSTALQWLNKFLNHPRTNIRTDMQCIARILNLIIHFELGNVDYLEYAIKSTYRFIYKRERMYEYERAVLRFLRNLINIADPTELDDKLFELQGTLEKIFEDPFEKRTLNLFNITAWLQSRLEGRTAIEVILEQSAVDKALFSIH